MQTVLMCKVIENVTFFESISELKESESIAKKRVLVCMRRDFFLFPFKTKRNVYIALLMDSCIGQMYIVQYIHCLIIDSKLLM